MATELRKIVQLGWRKHLASDFGIEGMLIMRERTPAISKGTSEEIIFEAGRATGWKDCLDAFQTLIATEKREDINPDNP